MKAGKKGRSHAMKLLSSEDVRHVAGAIGDDTVAAILSSGASLEEVEIAAAFIEGKAAELDRQGHHLEGKVAQVYDILAADPFYASCDDETKR
jgi:hypothetical protein